MANNIIHLDLAVAFDTVNSLQLTHKDIITTLHTINNLNVAMQDVWQGGDARKWEGEILDWLKTFGEHMEEFENLMYKVMKEFDAWQQMDVTGNFTPTHDFTYFQFSHEFTGAAEFLNSLKPLKPAPKKPNRFGKIGNLVGKVTGGIGSGVSAVTGGIAGLTGLLADGGKGLITAGKTGWDYTLKGGEIIAKGSIAVAGATYGTMKAIGGGIKDLFTTPDYESYEPEGKIVVNVNGQTNYYNAGIAIPTRGIDPLPDGYILVANGDLAIPSNALPASALPADAIRAIPSNAIPSNVMSQARPASELPDGLPDGYVWVANGNLAIPSNALDQIYADALPASALPALRALPASALPASALPASAINTREIRFDALPASIKTEALPASFYPDGLPNDYIWIDNGNYALPASALPASANPSSLQQKFTALEGSLSDQFVITSTGDLIAKDPDIFTAINSASLIDGVAMTNPSSFYQVPIVQADIMPITNPGDFQP